jgi:hypothetical protein
VPLIPPRRTIRRGGELAQVTVLPSDPRPLPTVDRYDSLLDLDHTAITRTDRQ